jgi:alpha-beta hydrolase superfamily lysophospholipase
LPHHTPPAAAADDDDDVVAVFEHLAAAGVAVYSYDVHGHGRSEPLAPGDRGLINDYNNLVRARARSWVTLRRFRTS